MTSSAELLVVARAATPPLAMMSATRETCTTRDMRELREIREMREMRGLDVTRLPSADQRHDCPVLNLPHHCIAGATLAAPRWPTIS